MRKIIARLLGLFGLDNGNPTTPYLTDEELIKAVREVHKDKKKPYVLFKYGTLITFDPGTTNIEEKAIATLNHYEKNLKNGPPAESYVFDLGAHGFIYVADAAGFFTYTNKQEGNHSLQQDVMAFCRKKRELDAKSKKVIFIFE